MAREFRVVLIRGEELGERGFARARDPDGGEAIGLSIGERAQQHGVHDAEDGGGGPDAESQGEDGERRETWPARAGSGGEAQVLYGNGDPVSHLVIDGV